MANPNWERRILNSYGSRFRIDIQNPEVDAGGPKVYVQQSTTDDDNTLEIAHQQNGIFHIYNDKTVEIVGGAQSKESGIDVVIAGKNGDVVITADQNGAVRIRGKNVIIQADEDVDIVGGRNVNLRAGSGRVLVSGNTLEKDGLKGNLLEPEEQWAYKVFEGTGLPADKFSMLASPFSGITDLAGDLVNSPDQFSSLITGAITDAVGGVIGNVTGGLFGN